jgi:hypothetical protein
MKPFRYSLAFAGLFVTSLSLLALAGCSGLGSASFPDAAANPAQVPVGTIQGSVYGGHAPLTGAHVYLLSPGTSGYGSQASSLLCNTGTANASCTTSLALNASDPNIPTSWYYETTDATGAFNLTGNYTCTAGNPVYIYAYGGSPTYPSTGNVFASNTFTIQAKTGSTSYTILFTTTTTQNFYIGEQITFSGYTNGGNTGTNFAFLNTQTGTVLAAGLSTTQFEVTVNTTNGTLTNSGLSNGNTYSATGNLTANPTNNPGVVNLATLGVCPSTGTLAAGGTLFNGSTSSPISYIYMNEVSTAVTAYAFEGFTPTTVTSTTNATDIGSSSTNLIGIENAALNAAQLYDINGSQITTAYAGEGHIANPKTPAGNGRTPQFLLDTMGNILAACVDSNNTSTVDGNASESPQCTNLFETATSNGIPKSVTGYGTIPVDTAQAMLNIAHYPAGDPGSTSTFMANLYGLPSGNVPFTPHLTAQPNDFTVAIQYSYTGQTNAAISSATTLTANPYANGPESIVIDGYGNVWMNDLNSPYEIFELTPQGVATYTSAAFTNKVGYLTVDPSNNVYSGSNYVKGDEIEILASGTVNQASVRTTYTYTGNYGGTTAPFNADGFFNGYFSIANGAGNIFISAEAPATIAGGGTGAGYGFNAQAYTLGLSGTSNGTFTSLFTPVSMGTGAGSIGSHGAIENASVNGSGYIWWSDEVYSASGDTTWAFVRVKTDGTLASAAFPISYNASSSTNNVNLIQRPEMAAVDQSGNLWAATYLNDDLLSVSQSGTVTQHTGATLTSPFGLAIDGNNNVFIGNRFTAANGGGSAGTSVAVYSIANGASLSPTTNNYTLGGQLTSPLNFAIDQSGSLWISAYSANAVVQWIGAGAPVYAPFSKASANNAISTRP